MIRNKKECPYCGKLISLSNYTKHTESCKKSVNKKLSDNNGQYCRFCNKFIENLTTLRRHELRCGSNPDRIVNEGFNNKGRVAGNKGLNKDTDSRVLKNVISFKLNKELGLHKDTSGDNNPMRKNPESRIKTSNTCLEKSRKGEGHTSLAKDHHYNYKGADLHCKGELAYAQWLDSRNIAGVRTKDRFEYTYLGKIHYYTPDFYLPETDEYVEVKGYSTGKDYAKWRQFPSNLKLTVLKKKELKNLGISIK